MVWLKRRTRDWRKSVTKTSLLRHSHALRREVAGLLAGRAGRGDEGAVGTELLDRPLAVVTNEDVALRIERERIRRSTCRGSKRLRAPFLHEASSGRELVDRPVVEVVDINDPGGRHGDGSRQVYVLVRGDGRRPAREESATGSELVDLSGVGERNVDVAGAVRRDTPRIVPEGGEVAVRREIRACRRELLDAVPALVRDEHIALRVESQVRRTVEVVRIRVCRAGEGEDERAVGAELLNPVVVLVGDVHVAGRVDRNPLGHLELAVDVPDRAPVRDKPKVGRHRPSPTGRYG